MNFYLVNFVFFLLFSSCFVSDGVNYSRIDVMNVIDGYSKSIAIKKGIILRIYGLDYAGRDNVYDGKIHLIDLGYSINKSMKYEEARELFYQLVDGLLEVINKTEYLKKYFYHTPVGYKDISIRLSFDYDKQKILHKDDVYQIAIFENKIMYHFSNGKEPVRMNQRQLSQDVYVFQGFSPEMRAIVRDLPEKEF
jgi:hypothetical protein